MLQPLPQSGQATRPIDEKRLNPSPIALFFFSSELFMPDRFLGLKTPFLTMNTIFFPSALFFVPGESLFFFSNAFPP